MKYTLAAAVLLAGCGGATESHHTVAHDPAWAWFSLTPSPIPHGNYEGIYRGNGDAGRAFFTVDSGGNIRGSLAAEAYGLGPISGSEDASGNFTATGTLIPQVANGNVPTTVTITGQFGTSSLSGQPGATWIETGQVGKFYWDSSVH